MIPLAQQLREEIRVLGINFTFLLCFLPSFTETKKQTFERLADEIVEIVDRLNLLRFQFHQIRVLSVLTRATRNR